MKLKEKLKQNKYLRKKVKNYKIKREMNLDYKQFKNNYQENCNTKEHLEYSIMLLVHSLEKGMCHENMRPFGFEKISSLIKKMQEYEKYDKEFQSTASKMGISIINNWLLLFDKQNWEKTTTYNDAKEYINKIKNIEVKLVDVGFKELNNPTSNKYNNFDYLDAVKTRHSVRNFNKKKLERKDIEYCIKSAILSPSACNRQMIKIYYIADERKKKELEKLIMGLSGFNKENVNLFVITFDISAFTFYGERNQGYLNAGLFSMNLVNAMHFRGIGSCFLQWGNTNREETKIKQLLSIPKNERIAIVIGAGYYTDKNLIAKSARKKIEEIYTKI